MTNVHVLRIGAVAAITGAAAQLGAGLLEPDWGGGLDAAVRIVADNRLWSIGRLLDLVGLLLSVAALAVLGGTLAEPPARDWSRAGQPFLVIMGAWDLSRSCGERP